MSKIVCEHPVLIFNPNLKWLFSKCRRVSFNGNVIDYNFQDCNHSFSFRFPWSDFYKAKAVVTEETADNYYLLDNDGCCYPVFMYVPCGKCRLCRNRKTEEWMTRCMCESACHNYRPLFITLTYRPSVRPDNMEDCKYDFQLFMKRLRSRVSRTLDVNSELRFVAVSEWTPKNHFPHIHMLLWGMPYVPCSEGDKNSFQSLCKFIQDDAWQNGIAKVEFARDCSAAYPLKYMRKGLDEDCWFLASRRKGIGYNFLSKVRPSFELNPDLTTISIPVTKYDKRGNSSCSVVTRGIPSYFKRHLFPTLSVLFPAKVMSAAKEFFKSASYLHFFFHHIFMHSHRCPVIRDMYNFVMEKYSIMHIDFNDCIPDREFCRNVFLYTGIEDSEGSHICSLDTRYRMTLVDYTLTDNLEISDIKLRSFLTAGFDCNEYVLSKASLSSFECIEFRKLIISMWKSLNSSYSTLCKYEFDEDDFKRRLSVTEAHKDYVRSIAVNLPEVNVKNFVDAYERDMRWIETHWMQHEIG